MSDDNRALMVRVEAGRLSASDLEHPDLQPLLLPLDLEAFKGEGSRLPGAVIKNPGGGKQKHWATCWVIDRKAKYAAASGEATAAAEYLRDPQVVARMAITEAQKQAALRVLDALAEPAGDIGDITP